MGSIGENVYIAECPEVCTLDKGEIIKSAIGFTNRMQPVGGFLASVKRTQSQFMIGLLSIKRPLPRLLYVSFDRLSAALRSY
jgi:hypothetical protein